MTGMIPVANLDVNHVIPFADHVCTDINVNNGQPIISISPVFAQTMTDIISKSDVIGINDDMTIALSEKLPRSMPIRLQISQTGLPLDTYLKTEIEIQNKVSAYTCNTLARKLQHHTDCKNSIMEDTVSLLSDLFTISNFKLPLPDHFFSSHGYRICLTLTALDEKGLQGLQLWLASAVVPLCTALSFSIKMLTTLSDSVKLSCAKEVRKTLRFFVKIVQSHLMIRTIFCTILRIETLTNTSQFLTLF